jgi:DUF4097 and DUF4098 domain-containing protein YvlB
MPIFTSPEPISVSLALILGKVQLAASERTDTVVEVRPTDPHHEADVRAAEQLRVEFTAGALLIQGSKPRIGLFAKPGSVDITIELPTGSQLDASGAMVSFTGTGRLGSCRLKLQSGDVRLEHTAALLVDSGICSLDIGAVTGDAQVRTRSGSIRVAEIDGNVSIKSADSDCRIGHAHGNVQVSSAKGVIAVDHCGGDMTAKTAHGDVRIGEIVRGSTAISTAVGEIEIGISAGSAAYLDAHTSFGRVRNTLEAADRPGPAAQKAQIRVRTSRGDILVHRA